MKKLIYFKFFNLFRYEFNLFWSNSKFWMHFWATGIDFIVMIQIQRMNSDWKSRSKSWFVNDLSQNLSLSRFNRMSLLSCVISFHWCNHYAIMLFFQLFQLVFRSTCPTFELTLNELKKLDLSNLGHYDLPCG